MKKLKPHPLTGIPSTIIQNMRVFKFLTVKSNPRRFIRYKWQMVQCFLSDDSILGSILHTIKKRIPKSACSLISTMKVLKLLKTLKLLKVSKLLKILKLPKTLSLLRRLKQKGRGKGKAVVEYKDPTASRLETLVEYVIISDSGSATDSEPEDPKGNEMGVDIDKVIELKTSVQYVIISDSETATDSEPEIPKGNGTGVETDKEVVVLMDLDSDHEYDDISRKSLRKRKGCFNKMKRKALKAKKLRFNDAEALNRELTSLHTELLNHFDKALNLDDEEMSVAKRKGPGSRSRPGCRRPSGSAFVMDRTGGTKKQQALKTKVPQRLVMTKPLNRILEGLKSEFTNKFKKLPEAPLFSEGESVAKNKGSGSSTRSVVGRAHGTEIRKALEVKAPQLNVAGPSSRGPKDDHIPTQKLVKPYCMSAGLEPGKFIGSGVCGGVDECEPSGSETMVARTGGANGVGLVLAQAKPLDHEVLNCMLNMNPSEFCTEIARNFRRII